MPALPPLDLIIILGSGLSECYEENEYEVIARATEPGIEGHAGRIAMLSYGNKGVMLCLGRRHLYEGYGEEDICRIVYAAGERGARNIIITNAAGGLDPRYAAGDIMLIDDCLGTMLGRRIALPVPPQPHCGGLFRSRHRDAGPFATDIYPAIQQRVLDNGLVLRRGVYAGVPGPSYETRAEIRMLRRMGAAVVGMSTVPEIIAAATYSMRVVGLSLITNVLTDSDSIQLDHLDVVEQGRLARSRMRLALDAAMELVLAPL